MKKLFLSAVVFSILFFIGCQENSITDPSAPGSLNKIQGNDVELIEGFIPMQGVLINPASPFNSVYEVNGRTDFVLRLNLLNNLPPVSSYSVSLSLTTKVKLKEPGTAQEWNVVNESRDEFNISQYGEYLLEKTFTIDGREDGMILICRFLVTTERVDLTEMFLALPEPP